MLRYLALFAFFAASLHPAPAHRMANASSPYLRQHAGNPIAWHPWGEEAIAKARAENKPIFLSSGYSTCHWCHVMARESFSDPAVAAVINEHFIAIKLDREERPDIDRIYLAFVTATTGRGGWPLNVWLTPDLRPYLGALYLPSQPRNGLPSFLEVARTAARSWEEDRDQVISQADRIIATLRPSAQATIPADRTIDRAIHDEAFAQLNESYDPHHHGFGRGAKFPDTTKLSFLLRYAVAPETKEAAATRARGMALDSLAALVGSPLHDVIGGGFHRYGVRRDWTEPHYEKMLYDQALIASVLLDAWQATGDRRWAEIVRTTLAFIERELSDPAGGFHSALDAQSLPSPTAATPVEGAYYAASPAEIAAARSSPTERARLLGERQLRPPPRRDEKIVTAWNAHTISAFARASQVLGEPSWLALATRTAETLKERAFDQRTGRLGRTPEQPVGFAEDYASLIHALLDLYEAGFDPRWLDWAVALQKTQNELFQDRDGSFFNTASDETTVVVRMKDELDGAEPSANSLSAGNLLRLHTVTGDSAYGTQARRLLASFAPRQVQYPASMPALLSASFASSAGIRQIVVAGDPSADDTRAMFREIHRHFSPRSVVLLAHGASGEWLGHRQEAVSWMKPIDGRATVYVCEGFYCEDPVGTPEALARFLARGK